MITPRDGWDVFIDAITAKCPGFVKIGVVTGKSFFYYHGFTRAASLTYTTFLAAVPFFILMTSIVIYVGFGSLLSDYWPILESIAPMQKIVINLRPILENAEHVPVKQLGIIGVSGLFITFMLAIGSLEINFNVVWENKTSRTFLHQCLVYSPILIVCAGVFGLFAGFAKRLHSLCEQLLVQDLHFGESFLDSLQGVFWFSSLNAIVFLIIFLMLFALPSRPSSYPKKRLVLTCLLSTFIAMLAIYVYTFSISQIQSMLFERYSLLYGSLAFLPLLLLLVFGIWAIILCANSLVWTMCNWPNARKRKWAWTNKNL